MSDVFSNFEELKLHIDVCFTKKVKCDDFVKMVEYVDNFPDALETERLKAKIMLGFLHAKDGKNTVIYLNRLRDIYESEENHTLFLEFQERCDQSIYPRVVTSHGYKVPIGSDRNDVITEGIQNVTKVLGDLGYEIFINSGTLLGVIRDNAYIPYDDDIDFGVILHADSTALAGQEWVKLKTLLTNAGIFKQVAWSGGIYKLQNISGLEVDLFPAWVESDAVFVYPHTCGELTRSDLLPLRHSTGDGLPVPNKPEAMLEINFGQGWKTPDPLFCFPWGQVLRKYKVFLDSVKAANEQLV